ncbi:zinc finger protein 862-like [Centruroides vittatus]|uniref:zinc finger protein 862-like n=1 Tax=Centruroides vittatus TaxID=120091 RepID=UPI0035100C04
MDRYIKRNQKIGYIGAAQKNLHPITVKPTQIPVNPAVLSSNNVSATAVSAISTNMRDITSASKSTSSPVKKRRHIEKSTLSKSLTQEMTNLYSSESEVEEAELDSSCIESGSENEAGSNGGVVKKDDKSEKKGKNYPQNFCDKWLQMGEFKTWLRRSTVYPNKAFCAVCQKTISGNVCHLRRHATNTKHKQAMKSLETVKSRGLLEAFQRKSNQQEKLEAELKLAMFCVEHNLPIKIMDHLPKLIQSVCHDSNIAKDLKVARTKTTELIKEKLSAKSCEEMTSVLQNVKFSLIIDETTDISSTKCLAVIARYFDNSSGKARDRFMGLLQVQQATAEAIYHSMMELLINLNIPAQNMIGFGADNASVMMGESGGVKALIKKDNPNIFVLGCVCHSFSLCVSQACNKLPRTIEDLVRNIYAYFAHSSKRINELSEFQKFVDGQPHRLLRLSQTRWLSWQAVVNRTLEQWNALTLYFTAAAVEDNIHTAQLLLKDLQNPFNKLYLHFLSYILELINKMNLNFQSERPRITSLLPNISSLFKTILHNYLKKDYVDSIPLNKIDTQNSRHFQRIETIYLGAMCEVQIAKNKFPEKDMKLFLSSIQSFYIVLSAEIKKKFPFDDLILQEITKLEPKIALSGNVRSVVNLVTHFPNIVPEHEYEELNTEWQLLPEIRDKLTSCAVENLETFWYEVNKIKDDNGDVMFPILGKLSTSLLSLPHSSACVERVFSQLNLIKTKIRNRLQVDTCNAFLLSKELLKTQNRKCYDWIPELKETHPIAIHDTETEENEDVDDIIHLFNL